MRKQSETVRFTRAIIFSPLSTQKKTLLQSVHARKSILSNLLCGLHFPNTQLTGPQRGCFQKEAPAPARMPLQCRLSPRGEESPC